MVRCEGSEGAEVRGEDLRTYLLSEVSDMLLPLTRLTPLTPLLALRSLTRLCCLTSLARWFLAAPWVTSSLSSLLSLLLSLLMLANMFLLVL